jgi:hypothetical protein
MVLAATIRTPGRIGWPLHVLTSGGKAVASFGRETQDAIPGVGGLTEFALATDETRIWTTESLNHSYHMTRWSLSGGQRIDVEVIDVPWMTAPPRPPALPAGLPGRGGAARPPPPTASEREAMPTPTTARARREDASGRLWVHGLAANPNWKRPGASSGVSRWICRVDVFDTRSWHLLASQTWEKGGDYIPGTNLLYTRRENEDGVITMGVWRMQLRR